MSSSRSCLECRRRKIGCDRKQPCSYCEKIQIECIYPAVAETQTRARRTVRSEPDSSSASPNTRIQALEDTVRRLEARLSNIEQRDGVASTTSNLSHSSSPGISQGHGSSASPSELSLEQRGRSAARELPLSSYRIIDLPDLADSNRARALWTAYLTDIDPLLKLVDHQFVEEILLTYPQTSAQGKALLHAIFFAIQACKPSTSIAEYESSAKDLETVLHAANVLSQPSMPTLQALTIYLTCGRLNMDQEYLGTMLSLLVRLATKLQLHRDPVKMGYLPSESELRRRLWWHILSLDIRSAEQQGSSPIIQHHQSETEVPSMVPDLALQSTTFFSPSSHAPCTFHAVVAVEMANIAKRVLFSAAAETDKASQLRLSDELHQDLAQKYMSRCKCADSPICRLTMEWCQIYQNRLKLLLLHWDKVFLRSVTQNEASEPDEDLQACVNILVRVQYLRSDPTYARWAWLWQNCVEWDAAAVALSMIAAGNCTSALVQQAWIAIDSFFAAWTGSFGDAAHQKRWRELETFRDWVRATQLLRTIT